MSTCKELIEAYEILSLPPCVDNSHLEKSELFEDIDIEHLRKIKHIELFGSPYFKFEVNDKKTREEFESKMNEKLKKILDIEYLYENCKSKLKKETLIQESRELKKKSDEFKYKNEYKNNDNNSDDNSALLIGQGFILGNLFNNLMKLHK